MYITIKQQFLKKTLTLYKEKMEKLKTIMKIMNY